MKHIKPILWVALTCVGGAGMAQEPLDTSALQQFEEAYRSVDERSLRVVARDLSIGTDPWKLRLSELAYAAFLFRSDSIKACLARLDTLDHHIPGRFELLKGLSLKIRALALKQVSALAQAGAAIDRALSSVDSVRHWKHWVDMIIVRSEIERRQARYAEALADLQRADRAIEDRGYPFGKANVLINLGNIYYDQDRLEEAWAAYTACLRYATLHGDERASNNAILNLGSTAHRLRRYEGAIVLYDSLFLALGDRDPHLRGDLRTNSGFAHARLGRHEQAIALYQEALALKQRSGSDASLVRLLQHLSSSYWELGRKADALDALGKALDAARQNGLLDLQAAIEQKFYRWYVHLGRTVEALHALERSKDLRDSLNEQRFSARMADLEVRYDTEKKEQTIQVQELELRNKQVEIDRKRSQQWFMAGAIGLLMLAGGLALRNLAQKRAMADQKRVIAEQRVDEVLRTQELKLVSAMVEGQELERKRIAQDLHDRLGSMLSAIKLRFSALEGWITGMVQGQKDQFRQVFDLLDTAVGEVRRVSHDMARSTVHQFGLAQALEDLRHSIAVPGRLEVELSLFGLEERMEPRLEVACFRIVQEMVSNALKHAKATHITLQVTRLAGSVNVMVSDNGRGFDADRVKEGMGFGNIRTRAAEFKGTMRVDSAPGRGTTISVDLPIA